MSFHQAKDKIMNKQSKRWYALYTRPQHEKKICTYLSQQGIHSFLPMTTEIRQWSDRKKKIERPLFPSYVFVHLQPNKLWIVGDIPGGIRFIGIGKQASPIPDEVIFSLQKIQFEEIQIQDLKLCRGERVRITSGKFIGVEGEFIYQGSKNMLGIAIDIMDRVVMIELESSQVRKLQPLRATTEVH